MRLEASLQKKKITHELSNGRNDIWQMFRLYNFEVNLLALFFVFFFLSLCRLSFVKHMETAIWFIRNFVHEYEIYDVLSLKLFVLVYLTSNLIKKKKLSFFVGVFFAFSQKKRAK